MARILGNCKECGAPTSSAPLVCYRCRTKEERKGDPCVLCGRPLGQSIYEKCRHCLQERETKILSEHLKEGRPYSETADAINALRREWFPKGTVINLISEGGVAFKMVRAGLVSQAESDAAYENIRKERGRRKRQEATPAHLRTWVLKRDKDTCVACKEPGNVVGLVTLQEGTKKDDPNNLATFCRNCAGLMRKGWIWIEHWFKEYARDKKDVFYRLSNYKETLSKLGWTLVTVVYKNQEGSAALFRAFPKDTLKPFYVQSCRGHHHLVDASEAKSVDPSELKEIRAEHDVLPASTPGPDCAMKVKNVCEKGHVWYGSDSRFPAVSKVTPGRNDPCSCGSGRKYKKCCGNPLRN